MVMTILTVGFLLSASAPLPPSSGWDKAAWGMTEDQVNALYPSAKKIHTVAPSGSITTCTDGRYTGTVIPYDLGQYHFSALACYLPDGKLDQVNMIAYPGVDGEYVKLVELLREQFGSECAKGSGTDFSAELHFPYPSTKCRLALARSFHSGLGFPSGFCGNSATFLKTRSNASFFPLSTPTSRAMSMKRCD